MHAIRLTNEYREQYESFVATHEDSSFLQSWSWGEFQNTQGKSPIRYGIFENEQSNSKLVGTIQLFLTKVPHLPGSYLYSPYGPLISGDVNNVTKTLVEQIKKDFANVWFIRLESKKVLPIDGIASVHIQPPSTLITDLSLSEDDLLAGMHNKTRYNIKVAEKHNIEVQAKKIPDEEGIKLLSETSERQGYKSYSDSYYKELLSFFKNHTGDTTSYLYEAMYHGRVIASAIMIDHGQTRTYLFGGSSHENKNVMAPYALHWQAMRDAKAAGIKNYDWWGIETSTGKSAGFVQFKLRWGGIQKSYADTVDAVLSKAWYFVYTILRKINRLI